MVEWKPSLNTGVEEIDAQHRTLFERAALWSVPCDGLRAL
jgi:hemerythrin